MTNLKFIKKANGVASDTYYNVNCIESIQEISSDQTDYKPRLWITMLSNLEGADFHFSLDISFDEYLKWLKSDSEILSVPEYPEINDDILEE